MKLELEELEPRTPATSLSLFADPLSLVEGASAGTLLLAGMTDSDSNSNPSYYSAMVNWGDGSAATQAYLMWNVSQFQIMGGHAYAHAGSYTISLTVNDYDGSQATLQETAIVSDAALTGSGNSPVAATAAQLFSGALGSFTDADPLASPGDFTGTINWGDGTPSTAATITSTGGGSGGATFAVSGSHTYASAGSYNYTVNIQDFGGSTQSLQGTVAVSNAGASNPPNYPPPQNPPPSWAAGGPAFAFSQAATPTIAAIDSQSTAEGAPVSLQVSASEANPVLPPFYASIPLAYDVVGLPPGLGIDHSTGLISGTMSYDAAEAFGGNYTPTVVVANPFGQSSSQSFTWAVTDTVRPPTFTSSTPNLTNYVGDAPSIPVTATQLDGDQLIYDDAGTLPSGLSIDSLSGVISGTVAPGAASSYNVTLTATDNTLPDSPQTATESFTWTINTRHSPVVTSPGPQTDPVGPVAPLQVAATDAPGNTLTYSATGLPDGLSIDPASGIISGTLQNDAAQSTPYQVTALVTDGTAAASQTFAWTVNPVGVNNPGDQYNVAGDAPSLPITGVDAGAGAPTFSATGLPQGLSISPTTGLISGTLAAVTSAQSDNVTVTAADGQNQGSASFVWNVSPLTLTDRTDVEGASVSIQTPEPNPNNAPSYAATGLPNGVAIGATTGLISGAIAYGDAAAGPYAVTVTTTYGGQYSTSQSFVWTVQPTQNGVPTLAAPANQTTVAGTQVTLNLSATETDEDVLTYSATGLPDGLTLDPYLGVISGVPAEDAIQAAPYNVTVTADDGAGATASQSFQWTVTDSNFILNGLPPGTTEGAGVQTFNVATYYDPDTNRTPSDYTATINWGDGGGSAGTVTGTVGEDTVSGDHIYLHPGSFTVQVSVTDPAGATTSTTETATVAVAPLTMTGGFVDGALTNTAANLTVATFTDGNTYDAMGTYTATVDWGDGTAPTAGVVRGADGEFTISGPHTYTINGTYTAKATVKDADGTTATATSTVTAGDLYAGVNQVVTVSSFMPGTAGEPASEFAATVDWGDGSGPTAAFVMQSGGNFNVVAPHAYGAWGVYTVVATVTDKMTGDTITAGDMVAVASAPAAAFAGAVDAGAAGAMGPTPLALFTLPQGASGLTATADWGDGTSSAVTLQNVSGSDIWEALGGHAYASMGEYAVRTVLSNAAGLLLAAAMTMEEPGAANAAIVGSEFVPGNSIYRYVVNIRDTDAKQLVDYPNGGRFTVSGDGATKVFDGHLQWSVTKEYTQLFVDVQFANTPGYVTITLPKANWLKGFGHDITFTVTVVQVTVEALSVSTAPFTATPAKPFLEATDNPDIYIDKKQTHGNTTDLIQSEHFRVKDAMVFQADVSLKGPAQGPDDTKGLKGVSHITVGFVQHLTIRAWEVHFPDSSKWLVASFPNDQTRFLDVAVGQPGPFYDNSEAALASGADAVDGLNIKTSDTPAVSLPVIVNGDKAKEIEAVWSFDTDVAAGTKDGAAGANLQRAAEATAAPWTFTASGTMAQNMSYTPGANAGVQAPDPNKWAVVTSASMENVDGPVFNKAGYTYVSKPDKP